MESFNYLQEAIDKSQTYGLRKEYAALGFKGNTDKYRYSTYSIPDPDNGRYAKLQIEFKSPSERKSESSKMLEAEILILDQDNNFVGWKSLYKNTKGIYFNKHSRKFYI